MTFDIALRLTELLLALAVLQQSAEHWHMASHDRPLFALRFGLALLLIVGLAPAHTLLALLLVGVIVLRRFDGPFNGGSDKMTLLILVCLTATHWLPNQAQKEVAFGYLSMQLILSYVISGWVKLRNPDWRSGQALMDVFRFSAYPVSEALRLQANHPNRIFIASWAVMLFEIAFPMILLSPLLLAAGLVAAAGFHLANACLFGLNRFFWIWLAAYPSLIWLEQRITG